MSVQIEREALDADIEIMEKEIIHFKGKRRKRALKAYRKLILPQLNEPIFLRRSE
jgi:hypothetical protein